MGLIINVFRNPLGDCTNNGVSARHQELVVVNVSGPFDPLHNHEDAVILERTAGGHAGCAALYPAVFAGSRWVKAPGWWMMGGNFGHTSDSRFTRVIEDLIGQPFYGAVAIHDRRE